MKKDNKLIEPLRLTYDRLLRKKLHGGFASTAENGNNGAFFTKRSNVALLVIVSDQGGWEHASVTVYRKKRCPTWDEMCFIKNLFWENDETVIQYHPAKMNNVSMHDYCLHLWRPVVTSLPLPPPILVGLQKGVTHS